MRKYIFTYWTDISEYNNPIIVLAKTYRKALSIAKGFVSPDCYKAVFTPEYKVCSCNRVFTRKHKRLIFSIGGNFEI